MKKGILSSLVSLLFIFASTAGAEVIHVWNCQLNDGKTGEDLAAVSSAWLKAARGMDGGADVEVHVNFPLAADAADGMFGWILIVPSPAAWGTLMNDYDGSPANEADLAFSEVATCSGSSLWDSVQVE